MTGIPILGIFTGDAQVEFRFSLGSAWSVVPVVSQLDIAVASASRMLGVAFFEDQGRGILLRAVPNVGVHQVQVAAESQTDTKDRSGSQLASSTNLRTSSVVVGPPFRCRRTPSGTPIVRRHFHGPSASSTRKVGSTTRPGSSPRLSSRTTDTGSTTPAGPRSSLLSPTSAARASSTRTREDGAPTANAPLPRRHHPDGRLSRPHAEERRLGRAVRKSTDVGGRVDDDVLPAKAAGMLAVFIRRGPWGHLDAHRAEAAFADVRIDSLAELTMAPRSEDRQP